MYLTRTQKTKYAKTLFALGTVIASLQLFLASSTFGNFSPNSMAILMGIISIIGGLNTALYQYLHESIPTKLAISGLIMAIVSSLGGLNDIVKLLPISGQTSVNIVFVISIITFILQLASKLIYVPKKK